MGLASKRRGGSGGSGGGPGGASSRSSKGSSSNRVKEKIYKSDDAREDGNGKPPKSGSGSRNRSNRRGGSISPAPDASRRRRTVDPAKLAWGMSSRLVGGRVSQQLPILTPDEVERDLRHMEAYENACTAYAQQFFIFHNRALLQSGHFGPVSSPGLATSDHYIANGSAVDGYGYQAHPGGFEGGQYGGGAIMQRQDGSPHGGSFQRGSQFAMPVRIDPEEEKRVALLRKRIAASEAQREILETEYISLRAHYVNESQKLLGARGSVDGQLKMLQQLVQKRGEVLALKRVRCAVARDILSCLERRTQLLENHDSVMNSTKTSSDADEEKNGEVQGMEGVESAGKDKNNKTEANEKELADILDVWNDIENQLRDAELACTQIMSPKLSDLASSSKTQTSGAASNSRRSKSPTRGEKDDTSVNGGSSKKKARRGSDDLGEKESSGKRSKDSASEKRDSVEDGIVPWEAQIMPRTPYGVPVFVSYMSSVPDKAAGFGCGGMFGSKKDTMCWLESNVPDSFEKIGSEREEMLRLREESQFLMQELDKERQTNKELQRQIISGRKRSDEMCAMMTMLRSETEAVLKRHNVLLFTPEARSAAQDLHSQALEEQEQHGDEYDDDEFDHPDVEGVMDEDAALKERHRSPHAMSPEEEGEVHEDDDVDDGEDQISLSVADGKGPSAIAVRAAEGDSESGVIPEDDNDGDDEGEVDDEEDGEIDERQKPPNEVVFGAEDGHHDAGDWVRGKEGLGDSVRGGSKRNFGDRDSEDGDDDISPTSSPHASFGSSKRRRRM